MSKHDHEEAERHPDQSTLLKLLERAEIARTNQNSVVWTVASLFAAADAVLAGAITEAITAQTLHERTTLTLAIVGVVLGVFAFALVDRGLRFMTFHEEVQRTIEKALKLPIRYTLSHENNPLYRQHVRRSLPAKLMLRLLCLGAIATWGAVVVFMWLRLLR
jgi:hypothetical protein